MKFASTRGGIAPTSLDIALAAGLAPDGGLYVPERIPRLSLQRAGATLADTATTVLAPWFCESKLQAALDSLCADAFDFPAPLRPLSSPDDHLLELISGKIRAIPGVVSTETFMYLRLRKQTYSWGVR